MRWDHVRTMIQERSLEALVLSSPETIYYLTNYQTPGNPLTVLIIPADRSLEPCILTRELECTNARYRSTTKYKVYLEDDTPEEGIASHLASVMPRAGVAGEARLVGFEANSARLTVGSQRAIERDLEARFQRARQLRFDAERQTNDVAKGTATLAVVADTSDTSAPVPVPAVWEDVSPFFIKIRNCKSEQEIEYVTKAAAYTLEGIRAAVAAMRPGIRETEVVSFAPRARFIRHLRPTLPLDPASLIFCGLLLRI